MRVLENLAPERVFYYFEEIANIPHGSKNTKQISDYCVNFAKEHNLEYHQDADNNIIIVKEASKGHENATPVIIQGHLDMVCEKTEDATIDMEKEGLQLFVEGDLVGAKNTTLGGDDGIAVAMALAILEDDSLQHPRIEAVFTVDEEIGMLGAVSIDTTPLKGKLMLNLDSEDEGVFTVSCAGGNVSKCVLPLETEDYTGKATTIKVCGLKGGHSGVEIDKGRANAVVLLGRTLEEIGLHTDLRIINVEGGLKDNAIPVAATATVVAQDVNAIVKAFEDKLQQEFATADPELRIELGEKEVTGGKAMTVASTQDVIFALTCLPNGIQNMSMDIKGLVKTSLNLGIVKVVGNNLEMSFCVRSSQASEKDMLVRRLQSMMKRLGGCVQISGDYPAWEYNQHSKLRELIVDVYKEQYGNEPKIEAIHAGVECGLFSGKVEGLDAISYGPNLSNIHTPRERMSIASVERVYKFTLEVLKRIQ